VPFLLTTFAKRSDFDFCFLDNDLGKHSSGKSPGHIGHDRSDTADEQCDKEFFTTIGKSVPKSPIDPANSILVN
jgi:hypothetical protein